jgi:hypothetical protein
MATAAGFLMRTAYSTYIRPSPAQMWHAGLLRSTVNFWTLSQHVLQAPLLEHPRNVTHAVSHIPPCMQDEHCRAGAPGCGSEGLEVKHPPAWLCRVRVLPVLIQSSWSAAWLRWVGVLSVLTSITSRQLVSC